MPVSTPAAHLPQQVPSPAGHPPHPTWLAPYAGGTRICVGEERSNHSGTCHAPDRGQGMEDGQGLRRDPRERGGAGIGSQNPPTRHAVIPCPPGSTPSAASPRFPPIHSPLTQDHPPVWPPSALFTAHLLMATFCPGAAWGCGGRGVPAPRPPPRVAGHQARAS